MLVDSNFAHLSPDQVSFYDETLQKQIEGSYRYNGKAIHVASVKYGAKSAPPAYFGARVDHFALALYAQRLLSELASDAEKDTAKPHSYKKAA
jgi:hypothetical protein